MRKILLFIVVTVVMLCAFKAQNLLAVEEVVDTVVAVVGEEIILLSELQKQVNSQMMSRGLDINSPRQALFELRDEVLQGMVDDRLLIMKAAQDSIQVDGFEVEQELKKSIATLRSQYSSEEAFQKGIEEYGLTEVQLRNMYSDAIAKNFLLDRLRSQMSMLISVTPQDMEAWITANSDSLPVMPERFKLSHILIYPEVSETRSNDAKDKLRNILERINNGEDFAEMARQFSEDPGTADNGGLIDYFRKDGELDPDFTAAAFALKVGEVSGIVESIYGYHLIKCEDIQGERVKARHIIVRLAPDKNDEIMTVEKLNKIKADIVSDSTTFEDAAKEFSQDDNSRELGGKLNWITSEQGMSDSGIPSFITNAKQMKIGDISEPFNSQYGYHIIKLDDFTEAHVVNIRDDRTLLEPMIKQRKFIDEYSKIIQKLRDETYIDIRMN